MLKSPDGYWNLLVFLSQKMAKTSKIVKQIKGYLKYPVQYRHRCHVCGRPRSYIRQFGLCRLCFREMANKGELPGIRKASW